MAAAPPEPPELKKGEDYYINKHGNIVFTAHYHLKRGYCCGSGCLHCPWQSKMEQQHQEKKTPQV